MVKAFLHLSKEEQRRRLLDRLDDPEKHWKFSAADLAERGYWSDYQAVYEDVLTATSTKRAPLVRHSRRRQASCSRVCSVMDNRALHRGPWRCHRRSSLLR